MQIIKPKMMSQKKIIEFIFKVDDFKEFQP